MANAQIGESAMRNNLASFQALPVWLYAAIIFWAPFPLGSNRPWSWSLLALMVAGCWILWGVANWHELDKGWAALRPYRVPALLIAAVLLWTMLQAVTWVPVSWANPIWHAASIALRHQTPESISINPWRTIVESQKLAMYAMAVMLVYLMAQRPAHAILLLDAIIVIGAVYGFYSASIKIAGFEQLSLFPSAITWPVPYVTGPFVSHNSYATFAGICALAAIARLISLGWRYVDGAPDLKTFILSGTQFLLGRGALCLLALLFTYSTLIASASRGGFLATSCGGVAMLVLGLTIRARQKTVASRVGIYVLIGCAGSLMFALFAWNGSTIIDRSIDVLAPESTDWNRYYLWEPALRMIIDRPLLGMGLGTYQDAYPLFASRVIPFVVDKAHNDYLEFAAGIGLPAAAAWWLAWSWLVFACLKGTFIRRRNRYYAVLAVGASVLIAVHSAFDFSLQIPAIALLYATILGIGLSHCRPTASAI